MKKSKNSIVMTMFLLFGVMSIMFISYSFYCGTEFRALKRDFNSYSALEDEMGVAKDLQIKALNMWQYLTDAALTKRQSVIDDEVVPALKESRKIIEGFIEMNSDDADHLKLSRTVQENIEDMWTAGNTMFQEYEGNWNKGNQAMNVYDGISLTTFSNIQYLVDDLEGRANDLHADINKRIGISTNVVKISVLSAVIVGLIIMLILLHVRKVITKPLDALVNAADKIAAGNLSVDLGELKVKNEIGFLAQSFDNMAQNLKMVIGQTIHSMDELSASSDHVANNSGSVAASTNELQELSVKGGELITKTEDGMEKLSLLITRSSEKMRVLGQRSNEIVHITTVIHEIAKQTNLLALNAAIEAARAGANGRGFAVVAGEVRKLAERTSLATQDIDENIDSVLQETSNVKETISDAFEEVSADLELARQAGTTFRDIVGKVGDISSAIEQIAAATEEQSVTSKDLSSSVNSSFIVSEHSDATSAASSTEHM